MSRSNAECPHCGATVVGRRLLGLVFGGTVASLVVLALVAGAALLLRDALVEPRRSNRARRAEGALRTIVTAQALFREGDKEGDGVFDFGSLRELSDATLIDGILGAGEKHGYQFQIQVNQTTPEFLWWASATPLFPSDPFLATNHTGAVYRADGPVAFDAESQPVGLDEVSQIAR